MAHLRDISAWLLLAAFFVGGVASPVLHRAQHGVERRAAASQTPCHRPDVHEARGPVWTQNSEGLQVPECTLCATRLVVVLPDLAPRMSPRVVGTSRVLEGEHVAYSHVVRDRTIRGPPHLVGPHLAQPSENRSPG